MKRRENIAFIDGQNVYMGTAKLGADSWKIDFYRFRTFLKDKYEVGKAYYFLGCVDDENQDMYSQLQEAGFILMFREHSSVMKGKKKGNVDTDIVFEIMKRLYEKVSFNQIILVSGDGDYKRMVEYLIKEHRFAKILFPNKKFASSLYKKLGSEYFDYLDKPSIRKKVEKKKRAP
jgi:uncharacterized LabA/DUF88 family protein